MEGFVVQVIKTQPVILTVENDQDSIAFAQRVIHARYQAVSEAIQANEALFHVQHELQHTQEDLRLAQWRLEDARRREVRALKREKVWRTMAIVFVVIDAVWFWRAL